MEPTRTLARCCRAACTCRCATAGCRCHPSGPYCRPSQAQRAGAGAGSRGHRSTRPSSKLPACRFSMALAPAQARKRWSVSCAYAVGAFDHVSRRAMLAGLQQCRSLQPLLPYVRQFYASDSTYVWQDAQGNSHEVQQSEGGEQGDPADARPLRNRSTSCPR